MLRPEADGRVDPISVLIVSNKNDQLYHECANKSNLWNAFYEAQRAEEDKRVKQLNKIR